ncbi:kynurenine 3-monooxygenase, mitochondrial precursor (Biosynthesis of nicotinic acid protein 4) [Venturia effusa]|uniref:Kynurenine 3-monooxygenase n=1 Tax=Venturia effusa TaxID=50376 RepID=A0A517KZ48_9PEZI|nr:kynurenine 3-monooxygenase, mitochondrial precursor (Biosynthesis of nicotinic acid protein 4) [Venturia effusa]
MATGNPQKTLVIGAGPVGALAALYAANRGDEVEVYELRGDLRDASTVPLNFTKSINLALSERGINSMRNAKCPGLLDAVLAETIPMYGRMIHGEKQGKIFEESQAYDIHGRYIRAVDRAGLNKRLLDELEKMPNVSFKFNHKFTGADFTKKIARFEQKTSPKTDHAANPTQTESPRRGVEIEVKFDFMIGADGAHSAVRNHLMKFARINYEQEYIDTLWCEFHIEPKKTADGYDFAISPNHLHIWPGGEFMFIAIPSLDKSFTCTLFLPESRFKELSENPSTIIPFFKQNFPGVVPDLISEEDIRKQYDTNPHLPLISIKCTPYHYGSSAVIIGDAAHAMVPFYGQGMNAGLEDVRVLYECLDEFLPSSATSQRDRLRSGALELYTKTRTPDAHAINDLALKNYQEMRSDVTSPLYLARKFIEERLYAWVPSWGWATQYSRVSFGNDRYSEVEARARKQTKILSVCMGVVAYAVTSMVLLRILGRNRAPRSGRGRVLDFAGGGLIDLGRHLITFGARVQAMAKR